MKYVLLVSAGLALSACAAGPSLEQQARGEAIQEILDQPLPATAYAAEERCISTRAYRGVEVLDDRHVLFEGNGDRAWVNRLRHRCIGLRPNETVSFELRATRLCELDSFRGVNLLSSLQTRTSATCTLGKFAPVTPEQVQALKTSLQEERRG